MIPWASICISTKNHAPYLRRTLDSIMQQWDGSFEVIVTDDGSTDDTPGVLDDYPQIKRFWLADTGYHNAVVGKNMSLRAAVGEIIIQQSDDVIHATPGAIQELAQVADGTFRIATVYLWDSATGKILMQYTGLENDRPYFFLGAARREDICRIGGYDPELANVVYHDDDWHAKGLTEGLGLKPVFVPVLGLHQHHEQMTYETAPATEIYQRKLRQAMAGETGWFSSGGPWRYEPGRSVDEIESGCPVETLIAI